MSVHRTRAIAATLLGALGLLLAACGPAASPLPTVASATSTARPVPGLTAGPATCTTPPTAQTQILCVELDVYSGRPNPTWDLTVAESAEFLRRFRALPPAPRGTVREELGYRGIVVTPPGGTVDGFDRISLARGVVLGQRSDTNQVLVDKDRALERWLFQTSKSRIDAAVYDMVAKELGVQ